jgi:hypothetical protein
VKKLEASRAFSSEAIAPHDPRFCLKDLSWYIARTGEFQNLVTSNGAYAFKPGLFRLKASRDRRGVGNEDDIARS